MPRLLHPLSRTEYTRLDDGTVRVCGKGDEGLFTREGVWISGARRTADPGLCRWVADGYTGGGGLKGGDAYQVGEAHY